MRYGKLLFRMTAAGAALCCLPACPQQRAVLSTGGPEGRLTVTATVVSSVGLVVLPNGEQRIIVANAADPKDNASKLQPVSVELKAVTNEKRMSNVPKKKR